MSAKLPIISLCAVTVGVLIGNTLFATNPEVGDSKPVQHGVGDLLNNSSWNQVAYMVYEWWLENQFGAVHLENLESSGNSRAIVFVGELGAHNVGFGDPAPSRALDWANENLVDTLYYYRITQDGHIIYCLGDGAEERVFCSFNIFAEIRPDSNSVERMVGVDLGPFGVGLVERGLLDRLLATYTSRPANCEGLP